MIGVLTVVDSGPAAFHLHLDDATIQAQEPSGSASVVVRLGDDGLRLGKPLLTVTVDGPGGYQGRLDRQLDTLLPGDTIDLVLPWADTLEPGDYTLTVSGIGPDMTAPVSITRHIHLGQRRPGAQAPAAAPSPAVPPSGGFPWPMLPVAGAALAMGSVLGARFARRRSQR